MFDLYYSFNEIVKCLTLIQKHRCIVYRNIPEEKDYQKLDVCYQMFERYQVAYIADKAIDDLFFIKILFK